MGGYTSVVLAALSQAYSKTQKDKAEHALKMVQ